VPLRERLRPLLRRNGHKAILPVCLRRFPELRYWGVQGSALLLLRWKRMWGTMVVCLSRPKGPVG